MDYKAQFSCDLHTHTNRSDGRDTPKELIDNAARVGLKVLVLSDHDVIPPETIDIDGKEISFTEYAKNKNVHVIPGIEISCETYLDDVHIVCLGCNWQNDYFAKLEKSVSESKIASYQETIRRIQEDGTDISWEQVLYHNGDPVMPEAIQKKHLFEALALAGFAPTWADAKKKVNAIARYHVLREKPNAVEVIENVHKTGGIAIMAHPFLVKDVVEGDSSQLLKIPFLKKLMDAGLDGIEARYPYHKTSYIGTMSEEAMAEAVKEQFTGNIRIISGGSDYHGITKDGICRRLGDAGLTEKEFEENEFLAAF